MGVSSLLISLDCPCYSGLRYAGVCSIVNGEDTQVPTASNIRVWKGNGKKVVFCIGWRAISDRICSLSYMLGNTVNM